MRTIIGCATDKGNYREKNQDRVMCKSRQIGDDFLTVACICDGVGSLPFSEISADIMIIGVTKWFEDVASNYPDAMDKEDLLRDLDGEIWKLNQSVCEYREEKDIVIGCTMSLVILFNLEYYIFHVGDSRIFRVHDSWVQLTKDEVEVRMLNGKKKTLLANYVGRKRELEICKYRGIAIEGDIFILGSDGLFKKLAYEDVAAISKKLTGNKKANKFCEQLIKTVRSRNEKDNASCILIGIKKNQNFISKLLGRL